MYKIRETQGQEERRGRVQLISLSQLGASELDPNWTRRTETGSAGIESEREPGGRKKKAEAKGVGAALAE